VKRALCLAVLAACGDNADPPIAQLHSSSIALSPDGAKLYVVNPDSDSLSIIDTEDSVLLAEVALGAAPPRVDATGAFTPGVLPRALVVAPDGATVYVTGERASALFAVDVASQRVRSVAVCSEPHGVLASTDRVFVACTQDASVVAVDMATFAVVDRVAVAAMPWALAWSDDGSLVVTHFQGPGVTTLDPATLAVRGGITLPDVANPGDDPRLAHGVIRGLYDAAVRPGTDEIWLPHLLLAIDTPQPRLDFETTVFPAVTIARADGFHVTLSNDALDIPGTDGAFADVVSGPHAIAFTRDGALALVVDTNSEDVLAIDAAGRVQAALLRPLPGHMPEGIAIAGGDELAYIDQRNTGDVAVVRIDRTGGRVALAVDGRIPRLAADPMPAAMRLGQHLFYSANSDEYPITRNHWVACASCHLEGRSDAVTWRFAQGPRDTPTNAGGTIGTGFLFRTADRTRIQDYWHTIAIEQGGALDPLADAALLDALAAYVDHAIPLPVPPTTDPALVAAGKAIFERADVGCATCHFGPALTDSGTGNPGLDLAGTVLLHDVGTCVSAGEFPDVVHADIAGHPREPCLFDTPSLRGIAASPPYLHDGSAPTLRAVLEQTRGTMGNITSLSPADLDALVEYMRSL
jgi:YVTN family beta-propeller protein